jgi:hypothetical protein
MHHQNTPLKVYESRRIRSICQKARSSRERKKQSVVRMTESARGAGNAIPQFGRVTRLGLELFPASVCQPFITQK